VLLHIGRPLGSTWGLGQVEPALLASLNRIAAAKLPVYMGKYAAGASAR
jgi:DNA polymerase-3 subunit epsilon